MCLCDVCVWMMCANVFDICVSMLLKCVFMLLSKVSMMYVCVCVYGMFLFDVRMCVCL